MTILFDTLGLPDHARPLARLINDYDRNLTLERLPERHPWLIDNPDKPYAVVHRSPQFGEYVVASYAEYSLDERIFANIVAGDARKHGWDMSEFDPIGAARTLVEARRREDELEAANDRMKFARNKKRWE